MQNRWIKLAVLVAGWAFLGFILSLEVYFNNRAWGMPVPFAEVALPQFGRVTMWALMAPLLLELRRKLPLRRGGWVGGIAFHLAMSFIVMAVYYLGRRFAYVLFSDELMSEFWANAVGGLASVVRLLQTGHLFWYALVMILGVIGLMTWQLWPYLAGLSGR